MSRISAVSGIFSGLNLGLMSLTVEDLNIIIKSSDDPQQVSYAKKILPLRSRGNLLLCTLLIGNTVVNVMLSVLTDPIWVRLTLKQRSKHAQCWECSLPAAANSLSELHARLYLS